MKLNVFDFLWEPERYKAYCSNSMDDCQVVVARRQAHTDSGNGPHCHLIFHVEVFLPWDWTTFVACLLFK